MHSSKLIQLLSVFGEKELNRIRIFLDSPYFNDGKKAEETRVLFQHISSVLPNTTSNELSKDIVYAILYPKETKVSGKLEKLMSRLLQLTKQFVIQEYNPIIGQEKQELLILSKFFRERHLENLENISSKKFLQLQKKELNKNSDYYFDNFLYEKQITDYYSLYNNRKFHVNLPATLEAFDQYYLLTRIEYACQLLAINLFIIPVDISSSVMVLDHLLPFFEKMPFEMPLLQVYYQAYLLLRTDEEDRHRYFDEFRDVLDEFADDLPPNQLKSLQALIRNYSILLYNEGNDEYKYRVYELYRQHLEKGYLYYKGELLSPILANIVLFGLRSGAYEWVYSFLQEHRQLITGTEYPEDVFNFNMAQYYFALKQYEEALNCLTDTYEDHYNKVAAKRLEIKIFYETESTMLDSRVDAFKIYVYRLKDAQVNLKHKEGNRNFIDILKQIRIPGTLNNEKRIQKLEHKIQTTDHLAEKDWLLEKVKMLV